MKELRTIIFTEAETIGAVVMYQRHRKTPLPPGTIKYFAMTDTPNVVATLNVESDYGETHNLSFTQADLAAALVLVCLDRQVPLPKNSQRTVYVVEGQLVLAFDIEHQRIRKPLSRTPRSVTVSATPADAD